MATRKIIHTPVTLAIDIGGTGIKMMTLDARGRPIGDRVRAETPRPATPEAVLLLLDSMSEEVGEFDRVSVGFPRGRETRSYLDRTQSGPPMVRL